MFFQHLGIVCLGIVSFAAAAPSDEANVAASRRGLLNSPESDISKRSSAGTIFVCSLVSIPKESHADLFHANSSEDFLAQPRWQVIASLS